MSEAAWYRRKAGECAQLAKDASDPRARSQLQTEEALWREIAERIEANERNRFGSDPGKY
jgi:hypothetical protein